MGLKKSFSKDKKKCTVTFTVSAEAAQGANTINIVGDFNSWSSTDTPMKKAKDGSFSAKIELDADKEYQFRYLLDNSRWENDWNADKYIPAPYSNADNSVVVTSLAVKFAVSYSRNNCQRNALVSRSKEYIKIIAKIIVNCLCVIFTKPFKLISGDVSACIHKKW